MSVFAIVIQTIGGLGLFILGMMTLQQADGVILGVSTLMNPARHRPKTS